MQPTQDKYEYTTLTCIANSESNPWVSCGNESRDGSRFCVLHASIFEAAKREHYNRLKAWRVISPHRHVSAAADTKLFEFKHESARASSSFLDSESGSSSLMMGAGGPSVAATPPAVHRPVAATSSSPSPDSTARPSLPRAASSPISVMDDDSVQSASPLATSPLAAFDDSMSGPSRNLVNIATAPLVEFIDLDSDNEAEQFEDDDDDDNENDEDDEDSEITVTYADSAHTYFGSVRIPKNATVGDAIAYAQSHASQTMTRDVADTVLPARLHTRPLQASDYDAPYIDILWAG